MFQDELYIKGTGGPVRVDGLTATYLLDSHGRVGNVVSSRPVPYFEVRIDSLGVSGQICIGFALETINPSIQPGWEPDSCGYDLSDGRRFPGPPQPWGPRGSQGSIIGAGYDAEKAEIYYTLNGQLLGTAF